MSPILCCCAPIVYTARHVDQESYAHAVAPHSGLNMARLKPNRDRSNQIRIIGGRWRRRKLEFPSIEGLRPTPDRIRETLFNWLQAEIADARVLDAYCGSGVLGLESLSRGASYACFIDKSTKVQTALKQHFTTLDTDQADAYCGDCLSWLKQQQLPPAEAFDIVFLDPPYAAELLPASVQALQQSKLLKPGGLLYIEHPAGSEYLLPAGFSELKSLTAGNNLYRLLRSE